MALGTTSLMQAAVACGFFVPLAFIFTRPGFFRRCVGEATAGALGAIRMLVGSLLFLSTIWEQFGMIAELPVEMRQPMGWLQVFYRLPIGFDHFLRNAFALQSFQIFTALILFLAAIGFLTRVTVPLGALCYFIFAAILRHYSFFWHQHLVALYVLTVLSFTPCADGWSFDRLIKIARGKTAANPEASARYGWARYACWIAVALPYMAAGLSKFRNAGFFWWQANNMRRIMYTDTLNPMQFDWGASISLAHVPDVFFAALGLAGIFGEALYGLVLVFPVARLIFPAAMFGMHVGIMFLQNILFFDLIFIQAIFYNWSRLREAAGRWLEKKRGVIEVLYDGWCPICQRAVRVLTSLDLFHRLRFVDFRSMDLAGFNRQRGLSITAEELEEEMYVVAQGRAYRGFFGYRRLALALPACWILALGMFLPGLSHLGDWVYRKIARNRFNWLKCDSHCKREPGLHEHAPAPATEAARVGIKAPLMAAGLAAVLLSCWMVKLEFFPFTAMQMYSGPRWRGTAPIVYYKVSAKTESGESSRALFNKAAGVMALNARYRPFLWRCFGEPKKVAICRKFLAACGEHYNRKTASGQRIASFEVEKWSWDYYHQPQDEAHGAMISRVVLDLASGQMERSGVDDSTKPAGADAE